MVKAMRDSGCGGVVLVKKNFVRAEQFTGKH